MVCDCNLENIRYMSTEYWIIQLEINEGIFLLLIYQVYSRYYLQAHNGF